MANDNNYWQKLAVDGQLQYIFLVLYMYTNLCDPPSNSLPYDHAHT